MISKQQMKILAFPYTHYSAVICDGAVRSGKTSIMMAAFVDWAMRSFDRTNFGICGKTVGSAIKNIILPYLDLSYSRKRYGLKFTRSDNKLIVTKDDRVNIFYVYGGKDESSAALIQGITLGGVLLDEVALMPRSFVEQALARCSVTGAKFWFNCNPESPKHWFYNEWVLKAKEKDALYLHFTLEDNPSLSPETLKKYYSMYSGVFFERFILGRWVRAEGIIYRHFADDPESFIVDRCEENLAFVTIGIDYGAAKSHTAFKATGFTNGYRTVYSLAEADMEGIHAPEDIYRCFEEFYLNVIKSFHKCCHVNADYGALGQVITNGLQLYMRRKGYPVTIQDCVKGRIVERIELVTQLMAEGRYKILRSCPRLIAALKDALWDPKHEDERLDDGTTDIDSLDAMEYSIFPYYTNMI